MTTFKMQVDQMNFLDYSPDFYYINLSLFIV